MSLAATLFAMGSLKCLPQPNIASFSDLRIQPVDNIVRIGDKTVQAVNSPCVVVSAGISDHDPFSGYFQSRCVVHAFDCTIPHPPHALKRVVFHKKCIGTYHKDTEIHRSHSYYNKVNNISRSDFTQWETIQAIIPKIDILKFDIEGAEWQVFGPLFRSKVKPNQLVFEVHLEGSNPKFVPPAAVKHKRWEALQEIMINLHSMNYTLISFLPNPGDKHCADMTFARCTR